MIPESMLETNPTMGQLSKELEEKKVCRICLVETEREISEQWNTVLTMCFTTSTLIAKKLPKYVCPECSDFLEKCNQFKQMCKQSELILTSYPLTGTLPSRVEVPSWFRSVQKRKQEEELSESPEKKICCMKCSESVQVRPIEVHPVKSTLQSPTITSEIDATVENSQTEVLSDLEIPATVNQLQQTINPNQSTVIQQMQTYVTTYQHLTPQYQYQPQAIYVPPVQQAKRYPLLNQQLQQPIPQNSINHQVLIPLGKPSQQTSQIIPQQLPAQQQSQQPMPMFQSPQPSPAYQTIHLRPQQPTPASNSVVQCKVCPYLFANRHHLVAHMRKHLGSAEYRCACARHFRKMNEYVNHLKQHTNITWCDLCGEQFGVQKSWMLGPHLDHHVKTALAEACDFCPLVFVDLQSRLKHVSAKHEEELRQLMELNQSQYIGEGRCA